MLFGTSDQSMCDICKIPLTCEKCNSRQERELFVEEQLSSSIKRKEENLAIPTPKEGEVKAKEMSPYSLRHGSLKVKRSDHME